MTVYREDDDGLETLLELNGYTYFLESGRCWVKFEARRVAVTAHTPHGISYSLTLHDRNNNRIIGYDNAHNYKLKQNKYKARVVTWDHIHNKKKVNRYEFETAAQLIEDFWKTVERFT